MPNKRNLAVSMFILTALSSVQANINKNCKQRKQRGDVNKEKF